MNPLETDIFKRRIKFLNLSQFWSPEKLEEYQNLQLRKIIEHAAAKVPYYREIFRQIGIAPQDIRSKQDLKHLPLLTKDIIQSQYDNFIPDDIDRSSLMHRSTGGSTGTPLTVYMDMDHLAKDKANTEHYMNVAGLSIFGLRSVRLYGDKIPQQILDRNQYWYVADGRKLVMSCYHMTPENVGSFAKALTDFRPRYIHSRPSALYPFARYVNEKRISLELDLAGIFLDGEMLLKYQRDLIEKVFGCRVFLVYGHTEGCAVGLSCRNSRLLHFMPQVGVLELLDPVGSQVNGEGEKGELVVTGFNNFAFPLIRYRTKDIGINTNKICPCGRHYQMLLDVEGRVQDYVIDRQGQAVPLAPAVFNYNDMDWKGIRQFKVIQTMQGKLLLLLLREKESEESPEDMRTRVLHQFDQIFGGTFDFELEFVSNLPLTKIGKYRYLDQHMDVTDYVI